MMKRRVLIVGLDGMAPALLDQWIEEGYLPTLARLMENGAYARLNSTTPPNSFPAWTSFMTGVNPGHHRVFFPMLFDSGTYVPHIVSSHSIKKPTLWQLLSEAGQQVGVIGMPMNYPPQSVNGFVVAGMEAKNTTVPFVSPPELQAELLEAVPDYVVRNGHPPDKHLELQEILEAGRERLRATRFLMDRYPDWDLFTVVFIESDKVSHYFWAEMDETYPGHENMDPSLRHAIRQVYQELDTALASLVVHVGSDTDIIVVSDHGFEACRTTFNVNFWLGQHGYVKWSDEGQGTEKETRSTKNRYSWLGKQSRLALGRAGLLPQARRLKSRFAGRGEDARIQRGRGFADKINWSQTKAYFRQDLGIRINLRGREPAGIVEPGAEFDALCDELQANLLTVVDPATGTQILKHVLHRDEVYSQEFRENAPDLILVPHANYSGLSTTLDASQVVTPGGDPAGVHGQYGILIGYGPSFNQGARTSGADITDMAPTILHLLGWQAPAYMDGSVWKDGLTLDVANGERRPLPGLQDADKPSPTAAYSEDDEEAVMEMLRNLGYIE